MSYFIQPLDHAQAREDKAFKHTFFQSERLLTGLNCLTTGQAQHLHDHADQDKFYFVLAGEGVFTVGDEQQTCGIGSLVLAPAGIVHGVENQGDDMLTFITVIAPFPS
ncbi:MAG: cupin domain-containing protein [Chloroflexota bacterium]